MSYNSKYTGSEVESLLDKVANGGDGVQCYIAQTALYDLLYDDGLIALPQNDMQGILDALTSRKLVLFPDALGIGTDTENNGYGVMLAGAAEDLLYFTVADTSGVVFAIEVNLDRSIASRKEIGLTRYNIKTINGQSLVGSGDITIEGGGSGSSAMPLVDHGTGDTTFELTPNVFHKWGEVASLTLTLGAETAGVANQYTFEFASGSTATVLALPDSLKWADDNVPTIEPNMIYQISILNGLAVALKFKNANLITNNLTVSGTTLTFDYPVASEVKVHVEGDGMTKDATFAAGDQTKSVRLGPGGSIEEVLSITPKEDSVYKYVYNA